TRCRATLGHAGEVHADLGLIDVRAVLQLQGRNPAVLVVVLDVRREMREREPGVDVVFVRQKQELVRMIRAPRADPIGAVFHPVAQVDRLGLLEEMPGRSAPRGGLATDQEVHLQGAASPSGALGRAPGDRGQGVADVVASGIPGAIVDFGEGKGNGGIGYRAYCEVGYWGGPAVNRGVARVGRAVHRIGWLASESRGG